MHNNIMAAGSKDRPPMLETGRYPQWKSCFLRYINTRPNGDDLRKRILEVSYHKLFDVLKQYQKEVNEIRTERIAKNTNPLALVAAAQQYPDPYYQAPKSHKSYAPTSKQSFSTRSKEATKFRGKEIAKQITSPFESAYDEDSDPEQAQRDKDMHKNLALIAKYFKKIYKPTNNNLKTSSNSRNKNVHNNAEYNVFANVRQHSDQPESTSNTFLVEKDDSNVTLDSPDMCDNDIHTDQNTKDERAMLANLIANLKLDVAENKKIQRQLKKENATLAHELKVCKSILVETSKPLGESNSIHDSCLVTLQNKQPEFERDLYGNDLLTGNHGSDLYIIFLQETTSSTLICLMAKASPTQAWLWHQRLSHLNFDYINLLSKKVVEIVSITGTSSTEQPPLKDNTMWSDQEKNIQKINRLARSLLIQGLPNDIYSLIDSNKTTKDLWDTLARHMFGSEYGKRDRKAVVLYEYETFKATEGELLHDTYICYLQWKQYVTMMRQNKNLTDINIDALYNILKQTQGDVNDAMKSKKKAVVITFDPLALVVEQTKVSKRKEKFIVSLDSDGSNDELKKITAMLAKAFNRKKFYSKPTNNNLRTSSATSSANKKQEYVKYNDKKEEKKVDEKKIGMSKFKCYNCKKEGYFAKDCKKSKVKDCEYYNTKMLLAKKDKDEQALFAEDHAWIKSSSDSG
nr:integrase, catalytic region, zinc finger, CCHC-type, peptidase aspartic, catalytic [Tanacetum cinerariifolium]